MARHSQGGEDDNKGDRSRQDYIDALLTSRRPPPTGDSKLLQRIEAKTAQHRSPFSANISRKHASILSALSPTGTEKPRMGHRKVLTPTREASTRKAFEVFEWDRDFEPIEPEDGPVVTPSEEKHWDTPPEPRPALTKYLASLHEEEEEEVPEAPAEPQPEYVPEAEDLIGEAMLEEAEALMAPEPEPVPETVSAPTTEPRPEPEEVPAPVDDVVVEGRPGHMPRDGGEFPSYLMEPLDDAGIDASAVLDIPQHEGDDEGSAVAIEHGTDISDEVEATPGETETDDAMVGLGDAHRWPSDTGLELHIDGFEHMASASDLCPRCGRRIAARNRLLTCTDCGTLACENCEMRTTAEVDAPYYYDWRFDLPLCVNCYDKAFNIQKALAKAKAALGMGNHTYAFYHAQQALRTDPDSPYAEDAERIISMVDRRRRESAEADEMWK
ncbi:MAG: zinc ribbon domain-containing protein, partial [Candidatus Thermoplasmatota archaeon]|nr:zinc ribbon domain-containing protein [Candidatus Thermoplasmatota archaeon]